MTVQQAREALGFRLRDIRKDARLTGRALAALAGWHYTKISKIEHGRTMPSERDLELWCFHCRAERELPDMIATVRGIERMYVELKRLLRAGTTRYQRQLLAEETSTLLFRIFDPAVIPGALQTRDYATVRLTEFGDMTGVPADIEATVTARMERAELVGTSGRLFHVVLAQTALRVGSAPPDVMSAQLGHLAQTSRRPGVRLGVLPTAAQQYALLCGFWMLDDREVQVETYSAAIRISQPREVALYSKVFDHYARRAVYGEDARRFIADARDDLGQPGETS